MITTVTDTSRVPGYRRTEPWTAQSHRLLLDTQIEIRPIRSHARRRTACKEMPTCPCGALAFDRAVIDCLAEVAHAAESRGWAAPHTAAKITRPWWRRRGPDARKAKPAALKERDVDVRVTAVGHLDDCHVDRHVQLVGRCNCVCEKASTGQWPRNSNQGLRLSPEQAGGCHAGSSLTAVRCIASAHSMSS